MGVLIVIQKLRDLAKVNRFVKKNTLADTLDETAELLGEAEALIRDFPVLIFEAPGSRSIVGATQTSEYAFKLGEWTRRRNAFLQRGNKP